LQQAGGETRAGRGRFKSARGLQGVTGQRQSGAIAHARSRQRAGVRRPPSIMVCEFCGLESADGVNHASVVDCVRALEDEVRRLEGLLTLETAAPHPCREAAPPPPRPAGPRASRSR